MGIYTNKKQKKNEAAASAKPYTQNSGSLKFIDNQPATIVQRELQQVANNSLQVRQLRSVQAMADNNRKSNHSYLSAIQRIVNWSESEVQTTNPIDVVMSSADWGFTNFIINGAENKTTPMKPPELSIEKNKFGLPNVGVAKEAINDLGTRMEIPMPAPWTANVSKKKVGGFYYSEADKFFKVDLGPYMDGDGDTALSVKGIPGDDTMINHTRDHEQHHVNDDKNAKDEIIVPWDNALKRMKQTGDTFLGTNPEHALARLYKEAGGTPAEIGNRYYERVKALGKQYHQTEEGSKPPLSGINISADQSTIELLYKPH